MSISVHQQALLAQMQKITAEVGASKVASTITTEPSQSFQDLLYQSLNEVNKLQKNSENMAIAYQQGGDVSLADVMIASQKANISMQGAIQVRNKLVQAYQDIISMQI